MKKIKRVKGFVMNKTTGHLSYAYTQQKKYVKSIGFTGNKNDFANKVKLKHNVDPASSRDCYVKTDIEYQKYNKYHRNPKYDKYRFHNADKPTINSIIEKNEKKNIGMVKKRRPQRSSRK